MSYRAVFFDAAGTLFGTVRPVGESYALLARKYGKEVSPHELSDQFHTCFSSAPPLAFPGAKPEELKELERNWWKHLVRRIFRPYGRFERFDDYFSELFCYFSQADSWSLYPETKAALSALRKKGLILEVVSNFDSRLDGILDGLGIAPQFDAVVISSRAGYAKPAPEIFHAALAPYGLEPQECLHVGDSEEKDALGAIRAGLKAALVDRKGGRPADSFTPVRDLKEILTLIAPES